MLARQPTWGDRTRKSGARPLLMGVPGYYWRGPDRRPEHRPVVTTGARRPPERNREWSTGPQPKPTGTRPAAQMQATP
jgi:hypothetical protein